MKFEASFYLDFPPDVMHEHMVDQGMLDYIVDNHPEIGSLELLEDKTEGNLRRVKVRYYMDVKVPEMVKKALKAEPNSFCIILITDTSNDTATFEVLPDIMADKFSGSGRVYFVQDGNKWIHKMEGEIKIKIFGVSSMLEKFAVKKAKESFGDEIKLRNKYLKKILG